MAHKRVLYISGSIGLGHVVRDLAIVKELRRQNADIEVSWLAPYPARMLIQEAGERIHPEADEFANDNIAAEDAAEKGFKLNLISYLSKAVGEWEQNVQVVKRVTSREAFDVVVGDEAYEISVALRDGRIQLAAPFVMIYDFIGNVSVNSSRAELRGTDMWNREWAKIAEHYSGGKEVALFAGELEDIPDTSLSPSLPNRRELAREACQFVGYILPFDPAEYANKAAIRVELGYTKEPLIVSTIGGTAVGRDLLTLCAQAYPMLKERIPDVHLVLVCGPRLDPKDLDAPRGVDVRGFVPELYKHLAACDLAIVQSGGVTTLELTALRRPFLYFALEEHFEQQVHVARRLTRHKAGVKMVYSQTTPQSLTEEIVSNLGVEVTYAPIAVDGAVKAAQIIGGLL
jgi:UDP:flavonoid glycosyltransferase YjiC (YdhE family)